MTTNGHGRILCGIDQALQAGLVLNVTKENGSVVAALHKRTGQNGKSITGNASHVRTALVAVSVAYIGAKPPRRVDGIENYYVVDTWVQRNYSLRAERDHNGVRLTALGGDDNAMIQIYSRDFQAAYESLGSTLDESHLARARNTMPVQSSRRLSCAHGLESI